MKRMLMMVMLAGPVLSLPMLSGCDRTVEEKKVERTTSDGTTVTDKQKTTESPSGDVKTTTEHKVDR
ncbi:MAG TPA: hypothetical protein VHD56_15150 [Tepidisphaeraceae bacterium]|nr:hypothetical protein [Tepidisphaeraceae bacterium]